MNTTSSSALREAISVAEMAQDVLGLSRSRLYELINKGVMPAPCYELRTRRPIYLREQQEQALAVRHSGLGVNGQPVIFYRCKVTSRKIKPKLPIPPISAAKGTPLPEELVSGLRSLGIKANEDAIAAAAAKCFPEGFNGRSNDDVLRAVFHQMHGGGTR